MFWVELTAALLTLVSVALAIRENVWTWPVGIISVSLYTLVFWNQQLHALAGLQVVFLATQVYGWYAWARGIESKPLPVRRATPRLLLGLLLVGLSLSGVILVILRTWPPPLPEGQPPSPLWHPVLDAGLAAFSLVAQWMLARKLLENWPVWIAVDVVSVGLFTFDGLYPSAVLYAILIVLCLRGWRRWQREGVA